MANSYEYVQIVTDEDWGLVGIVAPGSTGDKVKQMSSITNVSEAIKSVEIPAIVKLPETEPTSFSIPRSDPISINRDSPERALIKSALNVKKQKAKILTRHEPVPLITPAEEKVLNSMTETNRQMLTPVTKTTTESVVSDQNMHGLTARSRANNLLVGFGK